MLLFFVSFSIYFAIIIKLFSGPHGMYDSAIYLQIKLRKAPLSKKIE